MRTSASLSWAPLGFLLVLGGCTGLVGGSAATGGDGDKDPLDTDGDGLPDTVPSSLTQCKDLGTIDVAPATMRRLSRTEFDNTLHDLGIVPENVSYASAIAGDLSLGDSKGRGFTVGGPVDDTLALDLLNAAIDAASKATANLAALTGCSPSGSSEENTCARDFIGDMGSRLFRRPLTEDEETDLFALYSTTRNAFDHRAGIEATLAAMLTAPDFIYLFEADPDGANDGDVVPLDPYAVASRLSYFLWDSAPDETLLAAAAAGELSSPDQLEAQARRMLGDDRARRAVLDFFQHWTLTRNLDVISKEDGAFNETVRSALKASITATFEDAFFGEDGTLANLFEGTQAFVSDAVAPLFGVEPGMGDEPVVTDLDPAERRGILTHPAFLSVAAKPNTTSPLLRGLFMREDALCMNLPDPPATDSEGNPVDLSVPDPEPGQTLRERFEAHVERAECANCHQLIDPIGFGFENYDELGRYRTENEFGDPIDASGEVFAGGDLSGTFHGAVELAQKLAASQAVADCMGIQWFRFALGRKAIAEHDVCSNATTLKTFLDGGKTVQDLVVGVVRSAAFRHRRVGGIAP